MVEEALVESQISDSISLVKKLDAQGYAPSSVFWHYFDDAAEWRLLLAGPKFDNLLPSAEPRAYQVIAEALAAEKLVSLTIGEVKILRTGDLLVQAMRLLMRTDQQALIRAHFRDNMINGIFIKEMVVIRSS